MKNQTYKNFEWLVVDDGSIDETEQLVHQWINENNVFPIRYIKVKNGGKHRAINRGTELANGELFYIVNYDCYITNDALESIAKWEESISEEERFCGISGNRGYEKDQLIGETFDGDFVDATALEQNMHNIKGDKAEVYYAYT